MQNIKSKSNIAKICFNKYHIYKTKATFIPIRIEPNVTKQVCSLITITLNNQHKPTKLNKLPSNEFNQPRSNTLYIGITQLNRFLFKKIYYALKTIIILKITLITQVNVFLKYTFLNIIVVCGQDQVPTYYDVNNFFFSILKTRYYFDILFTYLFKIIQNYTL